MTSLRTLSPFAACLAVVGLFAFAPVASAEKAHDTIKLGLHGYSPVSYFHSDQPHFGSPEFSAQAHGVTYFFANQQELDTFNGNPEAFLPAYGGWCATGASKSKYLGSDPTNFQIVDGRLMLYFKSPEKDARAIWNNGNEAELVSKADAFYNANHAH
ncbi:MAG: YHS domain-containing (seleno)protein [Planctomycetota bacterium]